MNLYEFGEEPQHASRSDLPGEVISPRWEPLPWDDPPSSSFSTTNAYPVAPGTVLPDGTMATFAAARDCPCTDCRGAIWAQKAGLL